MLNKEGRIIVPFHKEDRERCLEIFRSNTPKYFTEDELVEYIDYLERFAEGQYWCLKQDGLILASGGIHIRADGVGRLIYGMVMKGFHRQGLGGDLLKFRMKVLAEDISVKRIQLDTSQFNPTFFEKFGFQETGETGKEFAPGLEIHEMSLELDEKMRARILDL